MVRVINGKWSDAEIVAALEFAGKQGTFSVSHNGIGLLVHNNLHYVVFSRRDGNVTCSCMDENITTTVPCYDDVFYMDKQAYLLNHMWSYAFNTYEDYKEWSEGCVDTTSELIDEVKHYIPEEHHTALGW